MSRPLHRREVFPRPLARFVFDAIVDAAITLAITIGAVCALAVVFLLWLAYAGDSAGADSLARVQHPPCTARAAARLSFVRPGRLCLPPYLIAEDGR